MVLTPQDTTAAGTRGGAQQPLLPCMNVGLTCYSLIAQQPPLPHMNVSAREQSPALQAAVEGRGP